MASVATDQLRPGRAAPVTTHTGRNGGQDRQIQHPRLGRIRYRIIGQGGRPLVAVLGGISADRRIDEWWREMICGNAALDPERYRLVGIDWLDRLPDARCVDTADQAAALGTLLESLGEKRFAAIVGSSFGAMVGLALAQHYPERIDHLIAISGAHRSTPSATAQRVLQRHIIRALARDGKAQRGLALARALALTGYRPDALFDQRFHDPDPVRVIEGLESYLEFNGRRFARTFDVGRYLALSEAIDRHFVAPESIGCPVDLVGTPSDRLVPLTQLRALAGAIGFHARLHCIDSPFGHDAFLKSPDLIGPVLKQIFDRRAVEVRHAE